MAEAAQVTMPERKRVFLIAHDRRKDDLLEWVRFNVPVLRQHDLSATGTTGALIAAGTGLSVERLRSGPLGGDQQVGARIADGQVDVLIFFWDPLEPMPHDPDVKALLRLAVLYNIPTACNRATADFMVAAPLFHGEYQRQVEDHAAARQAWLAARERVLRAGEAGAPAD